MRLHTFSAVVAVAAASFLASPVQAFSLGGNASYIANNFPNQLSVENVSLVDDGDAQFTVSDPSLLTVGVLFLEGTLGEFGITENSLYEAVSGYISGFEFLGTEAVLNLNAGENILSGFGDSINFTLASDLSGDIVDLDGTVLGTAVGSLSALQTSDQAGNFSITLEATPTNVATTTPEPGLLLGVLGLALGATWNRRE